MEIFVGRMEYFLDTFAGNIFVSDHIRKYLVERFFEGNIARKFLGCIREIFECRKYCRETFVGNIFESEIFVGNIRAGNIRAGNIRKYGCSEILFGSVDRKYNYYARKCCSEILFGGGGVVWH